jgi:hypothetical protein
VCYVASGVFGLVRWHTEGSLGVLISPKFRSFDKAEPISQFCEKCMHKKQIRILVSLICKLSGTPEYGATAPDLRSLCPLSSTEFLKPPPDELCLVCMVYLEVCCFSCVLCMYYCVVYSVCCVGSGVLCS